MARLSISLSEKENSNVSEIRVDGVVDTTTSGELEETIESLLEREKYRIIIDLAGVEYISSAGWGVLISRIRDIRNKHGDILLSGMVANVREVFELLEFDNVLKHFKSLDEARSTFGVSAAKGSSKKKDQEISEFEVFESELTNNGSRIDQVISQSLNRNSVEDLLFHSIECDPFMSIREITDHINKLSDTTRVGWWKVFRMLKKEKLLSKRSRFRLARGFFENSS
jgi:anti-sigma B factor antagonist